MISLHGVPVSFKEVWSTNSRTILINPFWTVTQFVETITPILRMIFNCVDIDIIEGGQDLPGIPAEAGFPLQRSNIRLKDLWGERLNVAFYIRRRNFHYPQLENLSQNPIFDPETNPIITNSVVVGVCPICFDIYPLLNRFRCRHSVCNNCYYRCITTGNNQCSLCRSK